MKGVILINAYFESEEYLYQPYRLKEEFEQIGIAIDIHKNDFFPGIVNGEKLELKLTEYDFCIFLDKDKYILKAISLSDLHLFNSFESIVACDDKMMTILELSNHEGIKCPKTLPGLLCYTKSEKVKPATVDSLERELGYPLIVKESYGSLGQGVYLVKNRDELMERMEKIKCIPHLFQQYIDSSYGKDIRVIVVGGKVLGAMLRQSNGDFRSNIGAGGCGYAYPLNDKIICLSERIADILKLDYCGIDLLIGNDDYYVCEVNSNAFFSGFEKATGINVAKIYANYIFDKISGTESNV